MGKVIISRSSIGSLSMWDADNGSLTACYEQQQSAGAASLPHSTCMDLCPSVGLLAVGWASRPMVVLKLTTLDMIQEIPSVQDQGPIRSCRFSPDGRLFARGYDSGILEILEVGS